VAEIERGRDALQIFFNTQKFPSLLSKSSEIAFLDEWLRSESEKSALKVGIMEREMEAAICQGTLRAAAELPRRD